MNLFDDVLPGCLIGIFKLSGGCVYYLMAISIISAIAVGVGIFIGGLFNSQVVMVIVNIATFYLLLRWFSIFDKKRQDRS